MSLSERDRGLLKNKVDELEKENQQLDSSVESDQTGINDLLLLDVPYKKLVDEKHYNIYAFEEELRLLIGRTIIGPVEEDSFWITAPNEPGIFIQIRDGRFIATKNNVAIVDVPIIPYRGYVVSSSRGPTFNVWTRDRYGSTTSDVNVPQIYTIFANNNYIKIKIDGTLYELKVISDEILEASNGRFVCDPFVLASQITTAFEETNANGSQCIYNQSRQIFTVVSNTAIPQSSAEVIVETTDEEELSFAMKFANQTMLSGRYANHKLKISIDGVTETIELSNEIRQAEYSSYLGYTIDEFSSNWLWDFSDAALQPSTVNNGQYVATLIQNKLREKSGGFKQAEVLYYIDSDTFVIYSGSFGESSSVDILQADDTNRDLALTIGMDNITDRKSNERSYVTVQELYDFLNNNTNIVCTRMSNSSKSCYSLMSILTPLTISDQNFILQTTSEYDKASLSSPRLYGNKLTIDDSNDKIEVIDGGAYFEKTIPHDTYSEYDLAEAMQDILNDGSSNEYTVIYKQKWKKFIIRVNNSVTFLFASGSKVYRSITTYIGFQNNVNLSGTEFISNRVSFSGSDFFSMAEIPQLVPMTWFFNQPPFYTDYLYGECNWLNILKVLLEAENNTGIDALDLLKNQIAFNNEAYLDHWERIAIQELEIETNQYESLRQEIAFYSRISTTDQEYLNKVAALNSSIANRNSLMLFENHASIMNIRQAQKVYTETYPDPLILTIPVVNNDKIYNLPAPEIRYADGKLLLMKSYVSNSLIAELYANSVKFELFSMSAFKIQYMYNGISGFAVSGVDPDNLFNILRSEDTPATMLSTKYEPYDLSTANQISVSVDNTAIQVATISASAAYIESTSDIVGSILVQLNVNDKFSIAVNGLTTNVVVPAASYSLVSLANQLQTSINLLLTDAVFASVSGLRIKISTQIQGLMATISLVAGIDDFLQTVYLDIAIPVSGSGDVFNIESVSSVEICNKINASINGLICNSEGSKIRVTTESNLGQLSSVFFTVNSFTITTGLTMTPFGEDADNKLGINIDGLDGIIDLNTSILPISGIDVAADVQDKMWLIGFTGTHTFFNRFDYPNCFKIVSNTYGPSSSVTISEKTIVVNYTNNRIDFEETSGPLVATISDGKYNGSTLANAIKIALDSVGISTYTVTYDYGSNKLTIISNGVGGIFNLRFQTGIYSSNTAASIMGFYKIDKIGSLIYTSDANIKTRSCFRELKYDMQTNIVGKNIIDARLTVTSTYISSTLYWSGGNVEDFRYYFNDYLNIKDLTDSMIFDNPAYSIVLVSQLWSRHFESFRIFNNDKFKVTLGNNAQQVVTFNLTKGYSRSDNSPDTTTFSGDTLILRVNNEVAQTITMPFSTYNGEHTAQTIQLVVRTLTASNVINQPAYTEFVCAYDGLYYLYSGTSGTSSAVSVIGGTLATKLKLGSNEVQGTGDVVNNYFTTAEEIIAKLTLTGITVSKDCGYLKLLADTDESITIESTGLTDRLGFFDDNLSIDPVIYFADTRTNSIKSNSNNQTLFIHSSFTFNVTLSELVNVNSGYRIKTNDVVRVCSTLSLPDPLLPNVDYYAIEVSDTQIKLATSLDGSAITFTSFGAGTHTMIPNTDQVHVLRKYEMGRTNLTVTYNITDNSLIDSRRLIVDARKTTIDTRLSQISSRAADIIGNDLTVDLYTDRWNEVKKRLNKKDGTYFKVGEKQQGTERTQNKINENINKINEINEILEG